MGPPPEKAFVFAAGLGTRMRPLTSTLPKPLVQVGGRSLLDHMLDRLVESGVEEAIVNVHWLADQIEVAVRNRSSPSIEISDERSLLLDQAGGIIKVLDRFGGKPFFICNTDAMWIELALATNRAFAGVLGQRKNGRPAAACKPRRQLRRRRTRRLLHQRRQRPLATGSGRGGAFYLCGRWRNQVFSVRRSSRRAIETGAFLF